MKYAIFKVEFLQEKIIVERREMAHSFHLEKFYYIRQQKNFPFFVSDYFNPIAYRKSGYILGQENHF